MFQVVPNWWAIPRMLACSRQIWLIAHQHARVVSSARGRAICSSCSVKTPTGHNGSTQRQVRLRHTSRTGRSKHARRPCRTIDNLRLAVSLNSQCSPRWGAFYVL